MIKNRQKNMNIKENKRLIGKAMNLSLMRSLR
jgi:hypothetical protein